MLKILTKIAQVRETVSSARRAGKRIGFVPTMGALHAGHISLIKRAVEDCDFVVISIFVNPAQFGPAEDFDKYPRDLERDSGICEKAGADIIFAPEICQMYPSKNLTWVNVESLTDQLCGKSRERHFRGVATVCTKLFNIVSPDAAFFGQKDAQQAIVIKRMVADLNMPLEIIVCPTVRQQDGLALSSRNKYLSSDEKKDALLISKALYRCEKMLKEGRTDTASLYEAISEILNRGKIDVEYVSIADVETLRETDSIKGRILVAIAGRVGNTRLIDNIIVDLNNL